MALVAAAIGVGSALTQMVIAPSPAHADGLPPLALTSTDPNSASVACAVADGSTSGLVFMPYQSAYKSFINQADADVPPNYVYLPIGVTTPGTSLTITTTGTGLLESPPGGLGAGIDVVLQTTDGSTIGTVWQNTFQNSWNPHEAFETPHVETHTFTTLTTGLYRLKVGGSGYWASRMAWLGSFTLSSSGGIVPSCPTFLNSLQNSTPETDYDAKVAEPVSSLTGNFTHSKSLVSYPGSTFGMGLSATYNSISGNSSVLGLGAGWATDLDVALKGDGSGNLMYYGPRGRAARLTSAGTGLWVAPEGMLGTVGVAASGNYAIQMTSGERWEFDGAGRIKTRCQGQPNFTLTGSTCVSTGAGQSVAVTWTALNPAADPALQVVKPTAVTSSTGVSQALTYDSSFRLTTIVAHDTSGTSTAYDRTIDVRYPSSGLSTVASISDPHYSTDGPAGIPMELYRHDGALPEWITAVKISATGTDGVTSDPSKETTQVSNTYDSEVLSGRVVSQVQESGQTTTFDWSVTNQSTVMWCNSTCPTTTAACTLSNHCEYAIYLHSSDGRLTQLTDTSGHTATKAWTQPGTSGYPQSVTDTQSDGRPPGGTGTAVPRAGTAYDATGHVAQRALPDPSTGWIPASNSSDPNWDANCHRDATTGTFPLPAQNVSGGPQCSTRHYGLETYAYDTMGRVTTVSSRYENPGTGTVPLSITTYHYNSTTGSPPDPDDNPTTLPNVVTVVGTDPSAPSIVTTFDIDYTNKRVKSVTKGATKTCSLYDSLGHTTATTTLASSASCPASPTSASVSVAYGSLGQVLETTKPAPTAADGNRTAKWGTAYSGGGRVLQQGAPDPATGFLPPLADNAGSETCKRGPTGLFPTPGVNAGGADCTTKQFTVTSFTYYPTGESNTATDELGNVTTWAIVRGDMSTATDHCGSGVDTPCKTVVRCGPNVTGDCTIAKARDGAHPEYDIDAIVIDVSDHQVQSIAPGGATTTSTYGVLGRLDTVTGPPIPVIGGGSASVSTKYVYDDAGRLTETQAGTAGTGGTKETTAYDLAGRVSSKTSRANDGGGTVTTSFTYDSVGNVLTETVGTGTEQQVRSTSYYATGAVKETQLRRTDLTGSSSTCADTTHLCESTRMTYDNAGRTLTTTRRINFSGPTELTATSGVAYDPSTGQAFQQASPDPLSGAVPGFAAKTARTVNDGLTTSGSPTVTSATATFGPSDVGRFISGAGIPAGSTITAVTNATTVTISNNATVTATNVAITIADRVVFNGATIAPNRTVTAAAGTFTARDIGSAITGPGIPAGAWVTGWTSSTTITISADATSTGSGGTFVFTDACVRNSDGSFPAPGGGACLHHDYSVATSSFFDNGSVRASKNGIQFLNHPGFGDAEWETSFGYDALGRQKTVTAPNPGFYTSGTGNATVTTTTCYTRRGETLGVIGPDDGASGTHPSATGNVYDPSGRLTDTYDPTALGSLNPGASCTDLAAAVGGLSGNTGHVRFVYDGAGRRTQRHTWDGSGGSLTERTETWAYNPDGSLASSTDALGNATTVGYTITNGRLTAKTTTTGAAHDHQTSGVWVSSLRAVTETYFPSGKTNTVTSTLYGADGTTVDSSYTVGYAYDTVGRAGQVIENPGASQKVNRFAYNEANKVTSVYYAEPDGTKHAEYLYDLADRNYSLVEPAGTWLRTLYDYQNRITDLDLAYGGWIPLASYFYFSQGDGTPDTYNCPVGAVCKANILSNSTVDRRMYVYEPHTGAEISLKETVSAVKTNYDKAYDRAGRLVSDCAYGGNSCTGTDRAQHYSYDQASQLIDQIVDNAADGINHWAWTYDNRGNRLSQAVTTSGTTATTYYAYDAAAELCQTNSAANPTCATNTNVTATLTYDKAGRRLTNTPTSGSAQTFTYDARGKVSKYRLGTVDQNITYDAFGSLKSLDNTWPSADYDLFYWDYTGNRDVPQIIQWTGNGLVRAFTFADERITSTGVWYVYDHLGSTTKSGSGANPDYYQAYGNPAPANTGNLDFTYRSEAALRGLLYLRNRYYDPTTGTFLTRDPLDGEDGKTTVANPYHYVNNDPLNHIDPLGLRTTDSSITDGLIGEACAAAGGRVVGYGSTGARVCLEPPSPRVEGGACFPPADTGGNAIVYRSGECQVAYAEIECARGDWIPGANFICQHREGILQGLTVIAVVAGTIGTAGAATEALVAIGGGTGIAFGGGALALAGGGSMSVGGGIIVSTALAESLVQTVGGAAMLETVLQMARTPKPSGQPASSGPSRGALKRVEEGQVEKWFGMDEHALKHAVLGGKAAIAEWNIYVAGGMVYLVKTVGDVVIPTGLKVP